MTMINWDFTFGGRAGCTRCQEVWGSELELCALAEGQIGAVHISFLFTTFLFTPFLLGDGRFGCCFCSRSEMCQYSHNGGGVVPGAKSIYFYSCHMKSLEQLWGGGMP